jgi:predicted GTPase
MKKYEYKVVMLRMPATLSQEKFSRIIEEQLNELGEEGWELCSVQNRSAYLKRELLE